MDATEGVAMIKKLVAMLEERGVEFRDFIDEPDAYVAVGWVVDGRAYKIYRIDTSDGTLCIDGLTPEQAIAATLGRWTCHADETDTWECVCEQAGRLGKRVTIHVMECSECGRTYEYVNGSYEHCPWCGRKVVGPTTNDVDAEVDDG